MAYTKTILCLAASRKLGGYCYAGKDIRTEEMTGAVLCVSLGEVYRGHAYKLVAAVIELPKGR